MGLSSRNSGRERFSAVIWPGFVDAMSTLLLVLIFALTIFMVLQSVLRQQITSQDSQLRQLGTVVSSQESELTQLGSRVAALSDALSTSQDRAQGLDRDLAAERARLRASEAAVAQARGEVDAQTEAARLAAARREALEALIRSAPPQCRCGHATGQHPAAAFGCRGRAAGRQGRRRGAGATAGEFRCRTERDGAGAGCLAQEGRRDADPAGRRRSRAQGSGHARRCAGDRGGTAGRSAGLGAAKAGRSAGPVHRRTAPRRAAE